MVNARKKTHFNKGLLLAWRAVKVRWIGELISLDTDLPRAIPHRTVLKLIAGLIAGRRIEITCSCASSALNPFGSGPVGSILYGSRSITVATP